MKIVIIGPGATGCLFAAYLARAQQDVWLLDYNEQRAKEIQSKGIKVEGLSNFTAKVKITHKASEIGSADLFLVCVKAYDTEEAVKAIEKIVGVDTLVMTMQNGLGNVQTISEIVGEEKVLACVTSQGANVISWGQVRHAGKGETIIGRADGKILGRGREIYNIFNKAGIETKTTKDINAIIWSKLIINVGINALCSISRLRNGELLDYSGTRELLRSAVSEAVKVAKRKRIKLIYDDPIQKTESVCKATSTNICSMLADVLKKRRTEIDYINGAIVNQGKGLGIATPVNEMLTLLVKTIESSYEKQVREAF
jgi:2-dehydropantoate 2-reductase